MKYVNMRLIFYMEWKAIQLSSVASNYFSETDREDMLNWEHKDAVEVYDLLVKFLNLGLMKDYMICPFCIYII